MKILMTGPFGDFSGYAHAGRNLANALHLAGADVALRSIRYDDFDYQPTEVETQMLNKPIRDCDIVMQLTTPNEIRYVPNKMNIAHIFWETTRIPKYWVDQLNLMDLIIAPCRFNAAVLAQCGIEKPICVCHPVFDMQKYNRNYPKFLWPEIQGRTVFYNVCQLSAKKGIDVLLKAYFRAFIDRPDEAILVLKVYINMRNRHNEMAQIQGFIQTIKNGLRIPTEKWPPVYVITDIMDDEDLYRLHKTGDAYVCTSRGEGWGIPPFEAMALGTPLISHTWSSLGDFVTEKNAIVYGGQASIVFDHNHPDPFLYTGMEEWFEPNSFQLMQTMRAFHDAKRGNPNGLTIETVDEHTQQALKDTREFDLRAGGPRIYTEIKRSFESWQQYGVVKPQDEVEVKNEAN